MIRRFGLGAATLALVAAGAVSAQTAAPVPEKSGSAPSIGRYEVFTIPFDPSLAFRSGTYTPSGKVLVSYAQDDAQPSRQIMLATQDDDGRNFRPFFSGLLPERPKDNGIRYMVFSDNKRIFMGDFVLECATSLETCKDPALAPVTYPAEVAEGPHVLHRWSEMIPAPDGRHVSWTTLFTNGTASVFVGELRKQGAGYVVADTRIISPVEPFDKDPKHPDGVIPRPARSGEVKQFVHGGAGISVAGGSKRDLADSAVLHLASGEIETITETPGYDETTIFSPDERLGVVMTARFSPRTDLAVLALMPRPYPGSLNMGLNSLAYNYSVAGVRQKRAGNIGPALIAIDPSKRQPGYLGTNLSAEDDWVFNSPLSWHPSGTRAMWIERQRGMRKEGEASPPSRMRAVRLLDYKSAARVAAKPTPTNPTYASSDLAALKAAASKPLDTDVKVYGRRSGYLTYRRTPTGLFEKTYVNFSDDGRAVYNGKETLQSSRTSNTTYTADVTLTGPKPGTMKLKVTFAPAEGFYDPTKIRFGSDASGKPLSNGYTEYDGKRLNVEDLTP